MSCSVSTDIEWIVGQQPKLTVTFRNLSGALADPTAVTFRMREPNGDERNYLYGLNGQLVRASEGIYYVLWTIAQAGRHDYSFTGLDGIVAYGEGAFIAQPVGF